MLDIYSRNGSSGKSYTEEQEEGDWLVDTDRFAECYTGSKRQ